MPKLRLMISVLAMTLVAGCDQLPAPFGSSKKSSSAGSSSATPAPKVQVTDPGVLALVNGTPLTVEMFRRRVKALPDDHPQGFMTEFGQAKIIHRKPRTADERRMMLDELIKEELAVQEALSLGLERDPDVKQRLDDTKRLILLDALNTRILQGTDVEQKEVEEYYSKYAAAFKVPERIHVRQIVVPESKEAEALRATAVGGADFGDLARQHSIGAGKDQGGDVGWYIRELDKQLMTLSGQDLGGASTFFPQLEPVAFALDVGQISQPVKGPDGHYYLIRLEEKTLEKQKPLTQIFDQLKEGLLFQKRQQKIQEYFERLWDKAKANVERNEHRLDQES